MHGTPGVTVSETNRVAVGIARETASERARERGSERGEERWSETGESGVGRGGRSPAAWLREARTGAVIIIPEGEGGQKYRGGEETKL